MQRPAMLILAAATAAGSPALAADGAPPDEDTPVLEEIVVRATFRGDDLSRVPSSVAVVPAEAIERRGATHLEEILDMMPNVNYAKGASRARFLQIRGIGERGQFSEPLNSSVGLVVDGVDLSGIGTVATLFDVEQVEVLRGPQGTRYGANALAGLVNVVTRQPTDTFESRVELSGGNYGALGAGAVVSGPLGEGVRGRLAARTDQADGFIENDYLNADDTDNIDETTVRGRLSWDADASTVIDVSAGYVDADNGYDAFSLDNVRTTLADEPGHDRQRTVYGSGAVAWSGNPAFTVQAHLGMAESDIAYGYDADWVFVGFHPWGYSGTDEYLRDRSTVTAEVRLTSQEAGRLFGGSTAWTAGAYAMRQDVELTRRSTFIDADFESDYGSTARRCSDRRKQPSAPGPR